MAQTTGAMSGVDVIVEWTNDGTNWTAITGSVSAISLSGFARQSGEAYTGDGDHAIVGRGKREPLEITVDCVYTETATETFVLAWTQFDTDDGGNFWVRYSPGGGDTGDAAYTSTTGVIINCLPPSAEAAPGDPLMCSFTLKCASIDKSTLASAW